MKRMILLFFVASTLCLFSSAAFAEDIIQDERDDSHTANGAFGQSFTAVNNNKIDEIRIYFETFPGSSLTLELFEGFGFSGNLIDTSTISSGSTPPSEKIFEMSNAFVNAGQVYTFKITGDSWSRVWIGFDNKYSGGEFYREEGYIPPDSDLQFQILMGTACTVVASGDAFGVFCPNGDVFTIDDYSCTFEDNGDGTSTMSCPNGDTVVIADGDDGEDGDDGTSCTVEDNQDGTATLSCEDGTSYVISNGADGEDGADGADGEDGTSCTVVDNLDGTATISCEDGESYTVTNGQDGQDGEDGQDGQDGQDGADGEDGTSCTVVHNMNGTATISCEDGTSYTVADGQDGQDGAGCDVEDNGDGTYTLDCDGETSVVSDGADGSSCTVVENDDNSATISCDDGSSFTVASGRDGADSDGGCSSTTGGPGGLIGLLAILGFVAVRRAG